MTLLERRAAIFEAAYANLRPLQVADNADHPAALRGNVAQALQPGSLLVLVAMRKIQPGNIEARIDHVAEHGGIVGGRSERGNDFGAALHGRDYCTRNHETRLLSRMSRSLKNAMLARRFATR